VTCDEFDAELSQDDPARIAAARAHASTCPTCAAELQRWNELSAAARSLHREWPSPALWPRIAAQMEAHADPVRSDRRRIAWWATPPWRMAAAVALVLAVLVPLTWYGWPSRGVTTPTGGGPAASERLLNEQALSEVERAEAKYVQAIDALSARATATIAEPASPLLMNLRERLIVIDAAIAECRAALERNRFNAHLRHELLSIYREKQRTLEQVLEASKNVS
jgi:hypothetical protein